MSDKDKAFFTGLIDQLCTDYSFHRDVAGHIAMKAWDNQHSNGYDNVLEEAIELSEFVESIFWLEMGNTGNHCFDESKYKGCNKHCQCRWCIENRTHKNKRQAPVDDLGKTILR